MADTEIMAESIIVAIDGPAAAGKGTLARRVAEALDLAYLDTGSLYRAVGRKLLEAGQSPDDDEAAVSASKTLSPADLARSDLRGEAVADAASRVSALPAVREALLAFQRHFAHNPPRGLRGTVLDGRDIGTVVCPEACAKLFVTASTHERARRRHEELRGRGEAPTFEAVLREMEARDARDAARAAAPLRSAGDAYVLDTSDMDVDSALRTAVAVVRRRCMPGDTDPDGPGQ